MDSKFHDTINYNIRRKVWAVIGADHRFDGDRLRVWDTVRNFGDMTDAIHDGANDERG